MRKDIPWEEVREAYRSGVPCRKLARRYGVSSSTVYRRRDRERWDGALFPAADAGSSPARLDQLTARLEALTAALLAAPEIDEAGVKDVKDLAVLVKELTALRRGRGEDTPAVIRVELAADVAPWAE